MTPKLTPERPETPPVRHWLTTFDPDDGEPIDAICECEIGDNHDVYGDLTEL